MCELHHFELSSIFNGLSPDVRFQCPLLSKNRRSLASHLRQFLDPKETSRRPDESNKRSTWRFSTNKKRGARGAAQDKTVVCLTPATALEDPTSGRANGAASARNPRRSHWVKAQTAIRRPGRSRNEDSRAPWRRVHTRSSGRPACPRKRLASWYCRRP